MKHQRVVLLALGCAFAAACSSRALLQEGAASDGGAGTTGQAGTLGTPAPASGGSGGDAPTATGTGGSLDAEDASPATKDGPDDLAFGEAAADPPSADAGPDGLDGGLPADAAPACPPFSDDGGAAAPGGCLLAATPTACSVTTLSIDPTKVCANATSCPLTAALEASCGDYIYPEVSMSANPVTGASVTLDLDEGGNPTQAHLFTLVPGGVSRVERFAGAIAATVAVDDAGVRNLFVPTQTRVVRLREATTGWRLEDVADLNAFTLGDVRVVDDTHAAVTFADQVTPTLVTRDGDGWHVSRVDGLFLREDFNLVGMDLDATGKPWLAALGDHGDDQKSFVDVVAPGGARSTVTSLVGVPLGAPVVLADGLTGHETLPALAYWQPDGLHVAVPAVSASASSPWTNVSVPGSAPRVMVDTTCPADSVTLSPCPGTSCLQHFKGAAPGLGFVRTTSGQAFVAWLDTDSTDARELTGPAPPCGTACNTCGKGGAVLGRTGAATLVIDHITGGATPAVSERRFRFDGVPDPLGSLAMAVRGDTLLVTAVVAFDGGPGLFRYFELDSTQLP